MGKQMSDKTTTLIKTPFHSMHLDFGAKMVNFGGWELPLQYTGIVDEHTAVRTNAGIFDVSHMGQIYVMGKEGTEFLQRVLVSDIAKMGNGQVLYSLLCNESGGIIDDLLVYRFSNTYYMLCVNAANIDKDISWLMEKNTDIRNDIKDFSPTIAMLALQGKNSEVILNGITDIDITKMKYYSFKTGKIREVDTLISRTGYTGEDGFELYFQAEKAEWVWEAIMERGKEFDLKLAGLGARDILRLEMGYPLHGNDLSEERTAIEANLGWTVSFDKGDFIGRDALLKQKEEGTKNKLIGFEMVEKGIPRSHYNLYSGEKKIGEVTSGTQSPVLSKGIGMGYVDPAYGETGTEIEVDIRGKRIKTKIIKTPFCVSKVKN